jgi:hypothetical protein
LGVGSTVTEHLTTTYTLDVWTFGDRVGPAFDPLHVLGQLTFEEKVSLLSGGDQWHTAAVPRLDIPRARVSDTATCPSHNRSATGRTGCEGSPCSTLPRALAFHVRQGPERLSTHLHQSSRILDLREGHVGYWWSDPEDNAPLSLDILHRGFPRSFGGVQCRKTLRSRGFESFGEGELPPPQSAKVDPYHAGTMAKAWIEGVQSRYVMTCERLGRGGC